MLKVKSGDLDKMALLFHRYHRPLFGFLYHMTGQREASEDMVQNVFYRMLRSRHTFTGEGEFKTWMYHLARNVWKDHLRTSGRMGVVRQVEDGIGKEVLVDEQLEKKLELEMLQRRIDSLNPESREVLVLSRYQNLKYAEIAEVLDISVAAVKVRIHRAIHQLKKLYLQTE
ncbi:MAG: RNA polymerase sigma factor [Bacteroidetes bacterium]|nr:RNA polymerase sigma factor [Bacteroidota bacterium]